MRERERDVVRRVRETIKERGKGEGGGDTPPYVKG